MLRLILAVLLVSTLSACGSRKAGSDDKGQASAVASTAPGANNAGLGAGDASGNDAPYPYAALVTCSSGDIQADAVACFSGSSSMPDTNLELRNGDKYELYQPMDIERVGDRTPEGMRIPLAHNFDLTMQNASDSLVLGVKIVNNVPSADFDKVLYEKKVGDFGVIKVSN
jgi:hypothetical protein